MCSSDLRRKERGVSELSGGNFRFSWSELIGDKSREKISEKIIRGSVPCMVDMTDIFEEIVDGFDEPSFSQKKFLKFG